MSNAVTRQNLRDFVQSTFLSPNCTQLLYTDVGQTAATMFFLYFAGLFGGCKPKKTVPAYDVAFEIETLIIEVYL
jgi:hypothetical protein